MNDLNALADRDNITVHINSVGGSLYVGAAIYNRLKGLAAHVTTVNDGLAASAGSLIFEAGDTRKVNAGSNLMIHQAAGFLFGYYQTKDLRAMIKQLDAHDKVGINIYAERTGRTKDEIKSLLERETWMTGQEAVDQGFADEVIGGEAQPVNMKLTPDRATMMVNGYPVAAWCMGKIPENVPVMSDDEWAEMSTPKNGVQPHNTGVQPAPQVDENTHLNGGNEMEIKNLEDLRNAHPDLVAQIENAAQASAIQSERARISAIEEIEGSIGNAQMVHDAKYGEKPMTAEQLAYAAMRAAAAAGTQMVNAMQNDANNGGANAVAGGAAPQDTLTEDEQAAALLLGAIPANMKKEGK